MTHYPGSLYSFWADGDPRPLYIGKAGSGPSGPAMRIQAHYRDGKPWAMAATTIRIQPMPGLTDLELLAAEQATIHQLRPRGNRQHNGRHHDTLWAQRTRAAHAKAAGHSIPLAERLALARLAVTSYSHRIGRVLGMAVALDVAARVAWAGLS